MYFLLVKIEREGGVLLADGSMNPLIGYLLC